MTALSMMPDYTPSQMEAHRQRQERLKRMGGAPRLEPPSPRRVRTIDLWVQSSPAAWETQDPAPWELGREKTWQEVLAEVAKKHKTPVAIILSPTRSKTVALARHEAAFRMAMEMGMTPCAIGRRLNRDYTTVRHSLRMYARRSAAAQALYQAWLTRIERQLAETAVEVMDLYRMGYSRRAIAERLNRAWPTVNTIIARDGLMAAREQP